MRVIGKKPEGEVEITCPGCFWKLAYARADIHHSNDPDEPSSSWYHYISCPKCNKTIKVNGPSGSRSEYQHDPSDYDL